MEMNVFARFIGFWLRVQVRCSSKRLFSSEPVCVYAICSDSDSIRFGEMVLALSLIDAKHSFQKAFSCLEAMAKYNF